MFNHAFGLIVHPRKTWATIAALDDNSIRRCLPYPFLMCLLAPVSWYYGTTSVGWSIGDSANITRLTSESAMSLMGMFYIALLSSVLAIGYAIHWMADTYGVKSFMAKGIVLASFMGTPVYLAGLAGAYPLFWLDICIGTWAAMHATYLLYTGIPVVMKVPEDRGFLFASAVVAVCMVIAICVMGATVILWEYVAAPVFVD